MLKNKKILLGLLVLLLLFILPNIVNAQTTNATEKTKTSTDKEVEWSYELSGNNITNLKCTNIAGVTGNLEIPETIDSHTVTTLGNKAFYECTGLTAITLPETITDMGEETFYGCSGLANVTISSNITTIGSFAFRGCTGLKNITIPNNVTSIGSRAFSGCSGLTNVTIPDRVTIMEPYAFADCSGLKTIKLSNNLTKLSNNTFQNCTALTEIDLPDALTTIGTDQYGWYSPFDGCIALRYIRIPKNVVSMTKDLFTDCKNLTIFAEEGSTAAEYAKDNNIRYEKIENWEDRGKLGSDVTAPTVSSMSLKYSNLIGYYNDTTNDYRIPRGVEIVIIVAFNEQITGMQIPTLVIKCGTGENIELKNGTISGKNIVYTYTIQQKDEGLITAVSLTGGDITDLSGNKAVLSVKELKAELSSGYVYANGSETSGAVDTSNNNEKTFNNHKYRIIDKLMTWKEAKSYCENLGGYLVTITSKEEQAFLESLIKEKGFSQNRFWIGATDEQKEGTWKWVTGEKFSYTNWGQGMPDNSDQGERQNYLAMTGSDKTYNGRKVLVGQWDDIRGDSMEDIYFICEWGDVEKEASVTSTVDTTTSTSRLPNTGRVVLAWIIGIISVSTIVAYVRYKKLYIK